MRNGLPRQGRLATEFAEEMELPGIRPTFDDCSRSYYLHSHHRSPVTSDRYGRKYGRSTIQARKTGCRSTRLAPRSDWMWINYRVPAATGRRLRTTPPSGTGVAASRYFSMNRRTSSSGIFTSANRSISFRGNGNRYCWPGRSPIAGKPTSRDASLTTCGSGSACALSISNPIWTI
jgi:hypothetical protein